jgi:hypothetical protein
MEKYRVKKIPINFFEETIYNPNKDQVNSILASLSSASSSDSVEEDLERQMGKLAIKEPEVEPINPPESDWVEAYSNKYQTKYWSNVKTGESVWINPNGFSAGKIKSKKRHTNKKHSNKKTTKKRRSKKNHTNKKHT